MYNRLHNFMRNIVLFSSSKVETGVGYHTFHNLVNISFNLLQVGSSAQVKTFLIVTFKCDYIYVVHL